ncbi:MAG: hypothetical protein JW982_10700 [Spirochaetes bacterium]|nr:hypothetical protein [Spirochaetota bacterium]
MRILMILTVILFTLEILPQSLHVDGKTVRHEIQGIYNINSSMFVDSYTPFTNYDHDNFIISTTLNGSFIDAFYKEPPVFADSAFGVSGSVDAAYALTNDIIVTGTLNVCRISGNMAADIYGDNSSDVKSSLTFSNVTSMAGFGFDYLNNRVFSIPVFIGMYGQYGHLSLKSDRHKYYDSDFAADVDVISEINDDVFIYGITGGATVSFQIMQRVLIVPYYFYMYNLNNPNVVCITEYRNTPSIIREKSEIDAGSVSSGIIGLDLTFRFTRNLSSTLSVGSLFSSYMPYYNELFFSGTKVINISLTVSYRN